MTSLPIKRIAIGLFAIAALGTICLALVPQIPRGGGGRRGRDIGDRGGVPMWEVEPKFNKDVFTFVRVKYFDNRGGMGNDWGKWRIDAPDSDNNFSLRLQQMTALKVNPVPIFLELTDTRLFDYPFLYMIEPGFPSVPSRRDQSSPKILLERWLYDGR